MKLSLNQTAPDFNLSDQNGEMHSLKKYHGQYVLLYFYPKDDTPGCTKEACSFRDNFAELKKAGVVILGASADSVKSHAKFAEKFHLNFPLLADEDKKLVNDYGVYGKKKFMGREYDGIMRTSFLIGKNGKIIKIYEGVKPEKHVAEILEDLAKI
jgi:peroxiredoxin Q/BCP